MGTEDGGPLGRHAIGSAVPSVLEYLNYLTGPLLIALLIVMFVWL